MKRLKLDPRTGLFILLFANIGMFFEKTILQGNFLVLLLIVLLLVYGCYKNALRGVMILIILNIIQKYIMPMAPDIFITLFSVFVNYTRRMLPCILAGVLIVKKCSLREMVAGMRKMHVSQKFIVAISISLRYFPAVKEEIGHIRDAVKLQNIPFSRRFECFVVPVMISATNTAQEISAAAVTRGIDNPAKKTSTVNVKFCLYDYICMCFFALAVLMTIFYNM